jgi:hypothetical protein
LNYCIIYFQNKICKHYKKLKLWKRGRERQNKCEARGGEDSRKEKMKESDKMRKEIKKKEKKIIEEKIKNR